MRFRRVQLAAPPSSLHELDDFYLGRLGCAEMRIGETKLAFAAGAGEPFYHFALLVPGNRFEHALEWVGERAELLRDPANGEAVFDFDNWDALACYFNDPAGNIVELIAHRGIDESEKEGPFAATELLGLSELGLVGDKRELAAALGDLGLEQWDGDLEDEARLGFVGEKARTFILSPEGRGWLPTSRPAEAHPCEVELSASMEGAVQIGGYRILGILPG
jgi:hypothetical protein